LFEPGVVLISVLPDDRRCIYIFHLTMFNTAKLFVQEGVYIDIGQEAKKSYFFVRALRRMRLTVSGVIPR
jgi:hypothetical protein